MDIKPEMNQNQSEETQNIKQSQDQSDQAEMCLAELSMWQDQCKRISADFENFKKRTEREQARWADMAKESILRELLSLYDTCQLALQQASNDKVAIEMMQQALIKLLAKNDVTVMPNTIEFDPQFHEAIMQVPSENHPTGQIVQFLSQGFMIKDRVLRPAKVSVAL